MDEGNIPEYHLVGKFQAHKSEVIKVQSAFINSLISGNHDSIKLWSINFSNPNAANRLATFTSPPPLHFSSLAFVQHRNGNFFFGGRSDGSIIVYKDENIEPFALLKEHSGAVRCLHVNKEYSLLVSGGDDCNAIIWSLDEVVAGKSNQFVMLRGHGGSITAIDSFNDVADYVVTGSADFTVKLWDGGKLMMSFPSDGSFARSIVCLDNADYIIAFEDGDIQLFNRESQSMLCTATSPEKGYVSDMVIINIDNDKKILAVALDSGSVEVFSYNKQIPQTDLSYCASLPISSTNALSISVMENHNLIVGSNDGFIYIFSCIPELLTNPSIKNTLSTLVSPSKIKYEKTEESTKMGDENKAVVVRIEMDVDGSLLVLDYQLGSDPQIAAIRFIREYDIPFYYLNKIVHQIKKDRLKFSLLKQTTVVHLAETDNKIDSNNVQQTNQEFIQLNQPESRMSQDQINDMVLWANQMGAYPSIYFFDHGGVRYRMEYNYGEDPNEVVESFLRRYGIPQSLHQELLERILTRDTTAERFIKSPAFEMHRSEEPSVTLPEVMLFKASQKLLNPDKKFCYGSLSNFDNVFTHRYRNVPGHIPHPNMITFNELPSTKIVLLKLIAFNTSQNIHKKLSKKQIAAVEEIIFNPYCSVKEIHFEAFQRGLQWKRDKFQPIIDALSIGLLDRNLNCKICSPRGRHMFERLLNLTVSDLKDDVSISLMRCFANISAHPAGRELLQKKACVICNLAMKLVQNNNETLQIVSAAVLANICSILWANNEKDVERESRENVIQSFFSAIELNFNFDISQQALILLLQSIATVIWNDSAFISSSKIHPLLKFINYVQANLSDEIGKTLAGDLIDMINTVLKCLLLF